MGTDTNSQPTCADRLPSHLSSRLTTFQALAALSGAYDVETLRKALEVDGAREIADEIAGDEVARILTDDANGETDDYAVDTLRDDFQQRLYEMPLDVSTYRVHRIDLSTGGPGDWLEAFVDADGDLTRIVYHFHDWFDHAEKTLDGDEFDAAEAFVTALIPEL